MSALHHFGKRRKKYRPKSGSKEKTISKTLASLRGDGASELQPMEHQQLEENGDGAQRRASKKDFKWTETSKKEEGGAEIEVTVPLQSSASTTSSSSSSSSSSTEVSPRRGGEGGGVEGDDERSLRGADPSNDSSSRNKKVGDVISVLLVEDNLVNQKVHLFFSPSFLLCLIFDAGWQAITADIGDSRYRYRQ